MVDVGWRLGLGFAEDITNLFTARPARIDNPIPMCPGDLWRALRKGGRGRYHREEQSGAKAKGDGVFHNGVIMARAELISR